MHHLPFFWPEPFLHGQRSPFHTVHTVKPHTPIARPGHGEGLEVGIESIRCLAITPFPPEIVSHILH